MNRTWRDVLRRQASSLAFGSIQIVIHDGRVVQIESSAKLRFDRPD